MSLSYIQESLLLMNALHIRMLMMTLLNMDSAYVYELHLWLLDEFAWCKWAMGLYYHIALVDLWRGCGWFILHYNEIECIHVYWMVSCHERLYL